MYNGWTNWDTWNANAQGFGEIDFCEQKRIAENIVAELETDYTEQDIKDAVEDSLEDVASECKENFESDFYRYIGDIYNPFKDLIQTPDINWRELITTCNEDETFRLVMEIIEENKEEEEEEEEEE